MTTTYNIIKDDVDYTDAWDKFSLAVSNSYNWEADKPLSDYNKYFDQHLINEGMLPGITRDRNASTVTFISDEHLTMFLLRWA
jgi:hypothetical protein